MPGAQRVAVGELASNPRPYIGKRVVVLARPDVTATAAAASGVAYLYVDDTRTLPITGVRDASVYADAQAVEVTGVVQPDGSVLQQRAARFAADASLADFDADLHASALRLISAAPSIRALFA